MTYALVMSPHCDDAVISLGDYLARACERVVIVNVFSQSAATIVDIAAEDVSYVRHCEDDEIARLFGFEFINLGFPDTSLRGIAWDTGSAAVERPLLRRVARRIAAIVAKTQPDITFLPAAYGLHPDHLLVLLAMAHDSADRAALYSSFAIYCDEPYFNEGKRFHAFHANLARRGTLHVHVVDRARKQRMLAVYRSQLSPERIALITDGIATERFWYIDAEWLRHVGGSPLQSAEV